MARTAAACAPPTKAPARQQAENRLAVLLAVGLLRQDLPLAHRGRRLEEQVQDLHPLFDRDPGEAEDAGKEGGVEKVAREDGDGVAEAAVEARLIAAGRGLVDHVIVDQGRGVQHLDGGREGGERAAVLRSLARRMRREQHQQRAQPLARHGKGLLDDARNQGGRPRGGPRRAGQRREDAGQLALHAGELGTDRGKDGGEAGLGFQVSSPI
jgi:hypothetical protein